MIAKSLSQDRSYKTFVPLDVVVYVLIAIMLVSIFFIPREEGQYVEIRINGVIWTIEDGPYKGTLPNINEDRVISVSEGRYMNIIRIEGGRVFFSYANCPSKKCVRDGKTNYLGDSRICEASNVKFRIVNHNNPYDGGIFVPPVG